MVKIRLTERGKLAAKKKLAPGAEAYKTYFEKYVWTTIISRKKRLERCYE